MSSVYTIEWLDRDGNIIEASNHANPQEAQAALEELGRRLLAYDDPISLEGDGSFIPGTLTWYVSIANGTEAPGRPETGALVSASTSDF